MTISSDLQATDFDTVMSGIIRGYDGWQMSNGDVLLCTDTFFEDSAYSQVRLPILSLQEGSWTSSVYNAWVYEVAWTIQGELVVAADYQQSGGAAIRQAITDLLQATMCIGGVPVDSGGNVLRYTPESPWLVDDGAGTIVYLVDRGGPLLRTGQVIRYPDRPFAKVKVQLYCDFYMSVDPRALSKVLTVKMSLSPLDPLRFLKTTTATVSYSNPVAGPAPSTVLVGLNITPYRAALVHPAGTVQLGCIATYLDGSVADVTATVAWGSSAPAVASVSASGLVTALTAGTASITATLSGHTSGPCVVTAT